MTCHLQDFCTRKRYERLERDCALKQQNHVLRAFHEAKQVWQDLADTEPILTAPRMLQHVTEQVKTVLDKQLVNYLSLLSPDAHLRIMPLRLVKVAFDNLEDERKNLV